MEEYLNQLLADIEYATKNVSRPVYENELIHWIPDTTEEETAPVRNLQDYTGIRAEMLPPESMLNDEQLSLLLKVLIKMLDEYNWRFVLQIKVPERIQYNTIRDNFDQEVKVKHWHMGFFEVCRPGTKHMKCSLGEYCHCALFAELFAGFEDDDDDLSPEEERDRELEIELKYIKSKYGRDWRKYYPYHLDKHWDDEDGNPYDYGVGEEEDDDDEDDWWKR